MNVFCPNVIITVFTINYSARTSSPIASNVVRNMLSLLLLLLWLLLLPHKTRNVTFDTKPRVFACNATGYIVYSKNVFESPFRVHTISGTRFPHGTPITSCNIMRSAMVITIFLRTTAVDELTNNADRCKSRECLRQFDRLCKHDCTTFLYTVPKRNIRFQLQNVVYKTNTILTFNIRTIHETISHS